MGIVWEWLKVIGMILFSLLVMFMTWLQIYSEGKGWDDNTHTLGVTLSWPNSRLINWCVFHLFTLAF